MDPISKLHSCTNRLLQAGKNDYAEIFAACEELYEALIQLSGADPDDELNREHKTLQSGKAIGLTWAAMCIKDIMRTKRFCDGVFEATKALVSKNPSRLVHILYAGTGPFATLVLPLTALFNSEQIQFTLLEINETSFACMKDLFSNTGLDHYVRRRECSDAITWKIPNDTPVDLLICEAMQQGLRTEPQVEICLNLVPQLEQHAILIPERITLDVALINPSARQNAKMGNATSQDFIYRLGTIFTLDKDAALRFDSPQENEGFRTFPVTRLDLSGNIRASHPILSILTEVTIYENEKLNCDESALTLPLNLIDTSTEEISVLDFYYQAGKSPGIAFNRVH